MSSDEESVPVNKIIMAKQSSRPTPESAPPPPRKYQRLPRTEAQKAATMKGLEALARRRAEMEVAKEAARLDKLEKAEQLVDEPKPKAKEAKQMPRALPGALTPEMLNTIKSQIREEVESEKKKLQSEYQERKKSQPNKKRTVVIEEDSEDSDSEAGEEVVVKRRKPKADSGKQRLLSGSDLLDSIFFKH